MGRVLVLDRWATRSQGNCQLSLLPHSAIRRRHDGRENGKINRLDKLGNTNRRRRHRWWSLDDGGMTSPAEAKIIVGGPRTRPGWGGNAGCNINTDACFDTCVSQGSSRPVLGRITRRADTAAAFTHTASLYGNGRSVSRCVARGVAKRGQGAMAPNCRLS